MYKIYPTFILLLFSTSIYSQDLTCGTDQIHNNLMETNIEYAETYYNQAQQWSSFQKATEDIKNKQSSNSTVYEVPVVFHIIHTGDATGSITNPSDATIFALVEELNQKFHSIWSGNPSAENGGVDVPIIFKLAQRTPKCAPSIGINRINASQLSDYHTYGIAYEGSENGAPEVDLKALSIWPNNEYLNIWIVTYIQGGYAGYAYYPGASSNVDGIVIRSDQLSWAITHEVGHSLGLRHTFNGSTNSTMCPPNLDCVVDGDMVCDTDPHPKLSTADCPLSTNLCTGTSFYPVVHNIMNYTYCPDRFTAGQKERMLFTLRNNRISLTTSFGDDLPSPSIVTTPPALACIPAENTAANNNFNVGVQNVFLADLAYSSNGYTGDNFNYYIDHSIPQQCMMRPPLIANLLLGDLYKVTVTTGYNAENVRGWIDFDNDGFFSESEMIISHNGTLSYESHLGEFIIPSSAVLETSLRMRIASDFNLMPEPCSTRQYGQTEDFIVKISDILSIQNYKLSNFKIYPNPTSNVLNLSVMLDKIEIFTIDGKKAFSDTHKSSINIESLQIGTYILKGFINDTNQKVTRLIIKE